MGGLQMIGKKKLSLSFLVIVVFSGSVPGQSGWDQLEMEKATIGEATVYYAQEYREHLGVLEGAYREFSAMREKVKPMFGKRDELIEEIINAVGESDINRASMVNGYDMMTMVTGKDISRFYLVNTETVKEHLKKGGQLPGFTYNPITDSGVYQFGVMASIGEELPSLELAIPISPEPDKGSAAEQIIVTFKTLGELLGERSVGALIHELTELTIVQRLKPRDSTWRWFSDGFADALMREIINKHYGEELSDRLFKDHDDLISADHKKDLNLRYWPEVKWSVKTSWGKESELADTRYAYAMHEAGQVIDKGGMNCVKQILDEAGSGSVDSSGDLIRAIKEVTGIDMAERLREYQSFQSREEGLQYYSAKAQAARQIDDEDAVLFNLLRSFELYEAPYHPRALDGRVEISIQLFKMGYEAEADMAMQICVENISAYNVPDATMGVKERFLIYCLETDKPEKGEAYADELLQAYSGAEVPLMVKLRVLEDAGDIAEAKVLAKKVLELVKNKESAVYKLAMKILGS